MNENLIYTPFLWIKYMNIKYILVMIENENKSENEKETWKDIPGYKGLYKISNTGKVKSMNYRHTGVPHILAPRKDNSGYQRVQLCNSDKKHRDRTVHRLVWEAFNGPIPEGLQINHRDENKSNNSLRNLEVVTPKQNANYGTRNIRMALPQMKPVAKIDITTGKILKEYSSLSCAMKEYGTGVSHAVTGRYKQAYGFKWKYLSDLNNLNS